MLDDELPKERGDLSQDEWNVVCAVRGTRNKGWYKDWYHYCRQLDYYLWLVFAK